jgi:uncharacterized protein (TIGR02996 family)
MRYLLPDGAFWEVTLAGKTVFARWGKGAAVKTRTAPFKSVAAAKRELEALVQKVRAMGYRPEKQAGGIAEALRANPDDDSPLVVYADELLTQDDPRGELAALVARGKKPELVRYLLAHATALFGAAEEDVHEGLAGDFTWAPGFVREVTFSAPGTADADELVAVTKRFLGAPVAELLREVNFGLHYESWGAAATQLTRAKHPELVTALRFDAFEVNQTALQDIDAGDFGEVWARLPELREFKVCAGSIEFGELVLPELRSFSWLGGGFTGSEVRALTRARWPKLERLELGFQREHGVDPALLTWLFEKPKALKYLALREVEFSPEQVEALLESELLPRLRWLDLSDLVLDEDAAEALRDGADQLLHLERLWSPFLVGEDGEPTMEVL